jgi:hypothetical protein
MNVWWIAPQFYHKTIQDALSRNYAYVSESLKSLEYWTQYATYLNVIRRMPYDLPSQKVIKESMSVIWFPGITIYGTKIFEAISVLVPLIGFIPVINKRILRSSEALVFASIAVVFIPLFTSLNPPFGPIFRWIYLNIPFYVLRRPPNYMFILEFAYAYLFGLGIIFLCKILQKVKKYFVRLLSKCAIVFILFLVIVVNAFPQWLGLEYRINMLSESGIRPVTFAVQPPKYVEELIEYLNHSPEKGGVLILPRDGFLRAYNWSYGYFGPDIYYLSLNRPVLSNVHKIYPIYDAYYLIEVAIKENLTGFAHLLELLNIKYIIVAEDALINPAQPKGPEAPTVSINEIYKYLSTQEGIVFVKRFGKHVLYKVAETPQKFYVALNILNTTQTFSLHDYVNVSERYIKMIEKSVSKEIYDDNERFWTVLNEGKGSFKAVISEDFSEKIEGTSSLKIEILQGDYEVVGVTHYYSTHQDWSNSKFLGLYIYGTNSNETINIMVYSGDEWNDYKGFTIKDNFIGWKRFLMSWDNPSIQGGIFNLSDIRVIRIFIRPLSNYITLRLDRVAIFFDEVPSSIWSYSDAIRVQQSNSSLTLTYSYTEERARKGFYWARFFNSIPLNCTNRYLYLNLKTSPNVWVQIYAGTPTSNPAVLKPINLNNESFESNLVSINGYTFIFDLGNLYKIDFLTIAIGVINPKLFGEYNITVNWVLKNDPEELTPLQTLYLLMMQKRFVAYSDLRDISLAPYLEEKPPLIEEYEITPTFLRVHVVNASRPFLLVSIISYDEGWIAEINHDRLKHIKINAMFNGWIVNRTGSYDIVIYYYPQQYYQLFMYVSFCSIIITLIILLWKPLIYLRKTKF